MKTSYPMSSSPRVSHSHPPLISVVTPCLNAALYVEEAIRSVMDQNYPFVEHIVIDGGSSDGTVSILRKYGHLRWTSEPDAGLTDALNKGLRRARGEIVGWLNADDYYLPDAFHRVARTFGEQASADIVYGNFELVDREGMHVRQIRNTRFDPKILFFYRDYVPCNAAFWRRRIHDEGHFPDASFKVIMDWEWWLRLAVAGYSFRFLPLTLGAFRIRHDNIGTLFADRFPFERDEIRARFSNHFLRRPLSGVEWTLLSLVYRSKRALLKLKAATFAP